MQTAHNRSAIKFYLHPACLVISRKWFFSTLSGTRAPHPTTVLYLLSTAFVT